MRWDLLRWHISCIVHCPETFQCELPVSQFPQHLPGGIPVCFHSERWILRYRRSLHISRQFRTGAVSPVLPSAQSPAVLLFLLKVYQIRRIMSFYRWLIFIFRIFFSKQHILSIIYMQVNLLHFLSCMQDNICI